jgi:hypothetical protein
MQCFPLKVLPREAHSQRWKHREERDRASADS